VNQLSRRGDIETGGHVNLATPPRSGEWRGPIPYSDHPRWSEGQNKGPTKRAKQEVFNRSQESRSDKEAGQPACDEKAGGGAE
jgi:hypothetical protein